ncbi:MAG: anthranilate phosphoribosyltransferase [Saprospiraceae bacterium]|nr:anthranilate phosphoribosyltransferase [Saprospiraceae bacterium]MDP4812865.1 anthranilate phosphoribosyltransferase [Saprospiraceae bacterium]MDP4914819.1 anthranilate phosphoribosyltransferase [Saprospiraceae bacterium]MDP5048944.1 anthranilate phosphoribosyltransferase [Saprospiraceae bacterium]
MKEILNRLFEHDKLSRAEAKEVLMNIGAGVYNEVQITAFTTAFNMRPLTLEELQGFRDALLTLCVKVDLQGMSTMDIVGTGGDNKNTFNISTLSCLVVAGAGYKVTKHGSYGVSSAVGSSDVLIQLGYPFSNEQDVLLRQLEKANICFLHAPLFHPALKSVVPVRKQLGTKTFFNIMGPLVNPVQPTHQMYGTFSLELLRSYQYIMEQSGRKFSIVYALDGYDEISLTGDIKWVSNHSEKLLNPQHFNLQKINSQDLHGGETPEDAATIFLSVLENKATISQRNVVLANAGLAIHTIHPEKSLNDCVAEALESIESGNALLTLKKLLS